MPFWVATPLSFSPAAVWSSSTIWANFFTSALLARAAASRDMSISSAFICDTSCTKFRSLLLTPESLRPAVPTVPEAPL